MKPLQRHLRTLTLATIALVAASFLAPPTIPFGEIFGQPRVADAAQGWSPVLDPEFPSSRRSALLAYDEARSELVLWGGVNETGALNDTWTWDGVTWTRKSPTVSPPGREHSVMAYDAARQEIVMFGGHPTGVGSPFGDTWTWDGNDWTRRTPPVSPAPRGYAAMAYDEVHGEIVLYGGPSTGGASFADTWIWDGVIWSKRTPISSPPELSGAAMAGDRARGEVVLFGGFEAITFPVTPPFLLNGAVGVGRSASTWAWDGTNWHQKTTELAPVARSAHRMAYDANRGRVVLFGGTDGSILRDTWTWDGNEWREEPAVDSPEPVYLGAMGYDAGIGKVVHFGGSGGGHSADFRAWDGVTWTRFAPPTRPLRRQEHAAAFDSARDELVIFGGISLGGAQNDTWTFDGSKWRRRPVIGGPARRYGAGIAYHIPSARAVMFGGSLVDATQSSETWLWNGASWQVASPPTAPFRRTQPQMTYDAEREEVVMFGGWVSGYVLDDTWVWDGDRWTERTPAHKPPPRSGAAFAYDATRGEVVMFGGKGAGSPGQLADTWTWDGSDWQQHTPATSPPYREYGRMAFDPSSGRAILFGGWTPGAYLQDVWSWDGVTWSQQNPPSRPDKRRLEAMVTDTSNGRIVLFGGDATWGWIDDLWTWGGGGATTPSNVRDFVLDTSAGVELEWSAPLSDGDSPVTEYRVYRTEPSGLTQRIATLDASVRTWSDPESDLLQPRRYHVAAANAIGEGPHGEGVSAGGSSSPSLKATPVEVNFGETVVGRPTREQEIIITNLGRATAFPSVSPPGGGFEIRFDQCSGVVLLPGASCEITMALRPSAIGAQTATVTATAGGSKAYVALSGSAVSDTAPPSSQFTTANGAAVAGGRDWIQGFSTDARAGVGTVSLHFTPLVGPSFATGALVTCDPTRRSCTWQLRAPATKGHYEVRVRAIDVAGNVELYGAPIRLTIT